MAARLHALLLAVAAACAAAFPASADDAPARVVSTNVCTDQLAMLVAAPGQLVSVSHLAVDPHSSTMADEAAAYRLNRGQAEEVFLMRPDLVLAGTYGAQASVDLLQRLGFRVERFAPVSSFSEVREQIARIGVLLGREERAAALAGELDEGLAALAALPKSGLRAVAWSSNSYATGAGTLSNEVMEAAGLENIVARRGIVGGTRVPLELLLTEMPDMLVTGVTDYGHPALAQENFSHPAFRAYAAGKRRARVLDALWTCGGPFTLEAVRILRDAADGGDR